MKSKRIILLVALGLVLAAGAGLWTAVAHAQATKTAVKPAALAVVDVTKVFETIKETVQVRADMDARKRDVSTEAQKKQQEITKLEDDLKLFTAGSPDYNRLLEEYEQKTLAFQAWQQLQDRKLKREGVLQYEHLYKRVLDAVAQVAKQNGVDLVLYKEGPVDFRGAPPESVGTQVAVRKVLWSADDLDLTNQVIQLMDNEYRARGSAAPTTQPTVP